MNTKHLTPGPWFAHDYAGTIMIHNGPTYQDSNVLDYNQLHDYEQVVSEEAANANAELITMAPQMFEDIILYIKQCKNEHLRTVPKFFEKYETFINE